MHKLLQIVSAFRCICWLYAWYNIKNISLIHVKFFKYDLYNYYIVSQDYTFLTKERTEGQDY